MTFQIERNLSVETAILNAEDILSQLPISHTIEKVSLDSKLYTTIVTINDNDNKYITQGNGKGIGQQSIASALYEALEHYILEKYKPLEPKSLTISQIISQNRALETEAPLYEIMSDNPDYSLECILFKEFNGDKEIYYPKFLLSPEQCSSSEYIDYSSNNGVACGSDLTEAILHGTCELIERHSLSKLYINLISDENFVMKKLDKTTLPSNISSIITKAEDTYNLEFEIYDIRHFSDFPVYLTLIRNNSIPISGCGCSLSSEYALERSVLECIQQLHLNSPENIAEDKAIINLFSESKEIVRALQFDAANILIPYNNQRRVENYKVDHLLSLVKELLHENGYQIYYHIIEKRDRFACVKIIIPGFEKFHLIRYGCSVCANT